MQPYWALPHCPAGPPPPVNCSKVVIPLCQGLGYERTYIPEEAQRGVAQWLPWTIGNYTDGNRCGQLKRQFWCINFIQPCGSADGELSLCRGRCEEMFEACGRQTGLGNYNTSDLCLAFPEKRKSSGICPEKNWPTFYNWPKPKLVSAATGTISLKFLGRWLD